MAKLKNHKISPLITFAVSDFCIAVKRTKVLHQLNDGTNTANLELNAGAFALNNLSFGAAALNLNVELAYWLEVTVKGVIGFAYNNCEGFKVTGTHSIISNNNYTESTEGLAA